MIESELKTLFYYFLVSGAVGSVIGAMLSISSGDKKLRLDASAGIGFLVGCGFGTLAGIFASLT